MGEEAYIKKAQQGNLKAFNWIVQKYQHYVYTLSFRIIKSREDAEEIAQDVFVKVHKSIETFHFEAKFSSWLYSITYRTAIDYLRKKNVLPDLSSKVDSFKEIFVSDMTSDRRLSNQDIKGHLQEAIMHLSGDEATVISLYYFEEYTVKELAETLDWTESNVKIKLFRARKNLKAILSLTLNSELKSIL